MLKKVQFIWSKVWKVLYLGTFFPGVSPLVETQTLLTHGLEVTFVGWFVVESLDDRSCWSTCALACIKTAVLWCFVISNVNVIQESGFAKETEAHLSLHWKFKKKQFWETASRKRPESLWEPQVQRTPSDICTPVLNLRNSTLDWADSPPSPLTSSPNIGEREREREKHLPSF